MMQHIANIAARHAPTGIATERAVVHPRAAALMPLLRDVFAPDLTEEWLIVAGLDRWGRLASFAQGLGDIGSIAAPMTAIRAALAPAPVVALVMAHNHVGGSPDPSAADLATTRAVAVLARLTGIELVDHLIFTRDGVTSFHRLGLL